MDPAPPDSSWQQDIPDATDPDGAFVDGEVVTAEQLAAVLTLVAERDSVAAIEDPAERAEAARWYQAALAGHPEPEERWGDG